MMMKRRHLIVHNADTFTEPNGDIKTESITPKMVREWYLDVAKICGTIASLRAKREFPNTKHEDLQNNTEEDDD